MATGGESESWSITAQKLWASGAAQVLDGDDRVPEQQQADISAVLGGSDYLKGSGSVGSGVWLSLWLRRAFPCPDDGSRVVTEPAGSQGKD